MNTPTETIPTEKTPALPKNQAEHPTVKHALAAKANGQTLNPPAILEQDWLRQLCLDSGADDVGFVSLDRPELDDQRADILMAFPHAKSIIVFACRMNREPIRSLARSLANVEFHHVGDHVTETSHNIARKLEDIGVRAMNEPVAFPMEAERWPKPWIISLKPLAEAAGLGKIGIHRNVIHPKFGNFILLGAVIVDRAIGLESHAIDFNPCFECKLCVAACPVGAISSDGHFNFNSCYTHNYREFMSGFGDWVETVTNSKNALEYRAKVTDAETVSMWQSLAGGPNYKAAHCVAVCPAGEDVIGPFLEDRKGFLETQVKPFQEKVETVYVIAGTDAEAFTAKRYPHKILKRVKNGIRLPNVKSFISNMGFVFQREQAKGLEARYHLNFTGAEQVQATVVIGQQQITVQPGLHSKADLELHADTRTWIKFLAGEHSIVTALISRKIRLKGPLRLLVAFGKCFPSA